MYNLHQTCTANISNGLPVRSRNAQTEGKKRNQVFSAWRTVRCCLPLFFLRVADVSQARNDPLNSPDVKAPGFDSLTPKCFIKIKLR